MTKYLSLQVGGGANSPYAHPDKTAGYIVKWIMGAKEHYNLTMDYIGVSECVSECVSVCVCVCV